ncbi:MAG TPA: peptidoglycan DD-metalloendopeptidase family protein [Thermoanaerobaculia bacterium]|nr:peptidoglycan DD-metalloendopeptidase family protein [Thermoanaerobaculia bacterium]
MAGQHNTIIFVPHAHAKLRKWRVTNLQIGLVVGAFLLLTLASAYFIWSHFSTPLDPVEVTRLQKENDELRQVNQTFEASIQKLQDQLTSYEDRTRDLAIVAGVESLGDGVEAGIGGGAPDEAGLTDLPKMQARAALLDGALDQVEDRLEQRMRWISSTPAITPVRGILTSGFGYRADPMTHGRGNHQGIDIAAAYGLPVHASGDGLVLQAGEQGGLGKAVFIAHGYGLTSRYGHMSAITVRPGQRIERGDVIGKVGNTGRSTGPHLHYEVRMDGEPLNPIGYMLDNGSGPL